MKTIFLLARRRLWFARVALWRLERLLFPSPAELALVRILGGKIVTTRIVRHWQTGYPLAFVVWRPPIFRVEKVRREVRVGGFYVDFGNDIQRGIEVLGAKYHTRVLEEQERADYLAMRGWVVLYIRAWDVFYRPEQTIKQVTEFLSR